MTDNTIPTWLSNLAYTLQLVEPGDTIIVEVEGPDMRRATIHLDVRTLDLHLEEGKKS